MPKGIPNVTTKTGIPFFPRRPHGTVHGTGIPGAVFEQTGVDGVGRLYGSAPDYRRILVDGQELEDYKGDKPAPAAAPKVKVAREEGQSTPLGRRANMPPSGGEAKGMNLDTLKAWGRGEVQAPFDDVATAIKREFDVDAADENDASTVLVGQGLLKAEEVRVSA